MILNGLNFENHLK